MFQNAIKKIQQFTAPIVISIRRHDGSTSSSIGTYIILNENGWILTANHIVEGIRNTKTEVDLYNEYMQKKSEIVSNLNLTKTEKKKENQATCETIRKKSYYKLFDLVRQRIGT